MAVGVVFLQKGNPSHIQGNMGGHKRIAQSWRHFRYFGN